MSLDASLGNISVSISADTTKAVGGLKKLDKSLDNLDKRLEKSHQHASAWGMIVQMAMVGAAVAVTVSLFKYGDAVTSIDNKLKLATKDTSELAKVTEQLFKASNETRSSVEGTVGLYAKLERSTRDLGLSQSRLLNLTKDINKSFAISGASTEEASGSIRQLGQALASGVLRGDEFNSIAEQAPIIMEAVKAATGKTAGELRKLAETGALTAEILVKSLERYSKTINREFATSTATFAQKLEISKNNAIKFVKENDSLTSSVENTGDAILFLSKNIDGVITSVQLAAVAFGSKFAGGLATSTAAKLKAASATRALTISEASAANSALAAAKSNKIKAVSSLQSAKANQAYAQTAIFAATTDKQLAVANAALTTSNEALLISTNAVSASQTKMAIAANVASAANTKMAATATLAGRAMIGLRSTMALLGGPVGVLLTVAGSLALFVDWESDAEKQTKKTNSEIDKQIESLNGLGKAQLQIKIRKFSQEQNKLNEKIVKQRKVIKDLKGEEKKAKLATTGLGASFAKVSAEVFAAEKKLIGFENQMASLSKLGESLFKQKFELVSPEESFTRRKEFDKDLVSIGEDKDGKSIPVPDNTDFIQSIIDTGKTEEQLENALHEAKLARLSTLNENELKLIGGAKSAKESLEVAHQENLRAIRESDPLIQMLISASQTEAELENERYQAKLERLATFTEEELAIVGGAALAKEQIEKDHRQKIRGIEEAERKAKLAILTSTLDAAVVALNVGGKKAQKVQQGLAITNALIKGKEAAVSAWAAGMSTGGPFAPLVAASYTAASLTQTAGLISSIKSGGKGSSSAGGGGFSSPSGSSSTTGNGGSSQQVQATAPRNISINLTGQGLFTTEQVRELITQLNDQVGDGVQLSTGG